MIYQVIIPFTVEQDIEQILDYYMAVNPAFAIELLNLFAQKFNDLKQMPERGRIVPELYPYNEVRYRELIEQYWRIFYTVLQDTVLIVAVIDSRQDVKDILLKKLQRKI